MNKPERPIAVVDGRRAPAARVEPRSRVNRDFVLRRLLLTADLVGLVVALAVSIALFANSDVLTSIFWGLVALPGWILIFKIYGLYDRDSKRVSHATVDDVPWIFHSLVIGSLLLWLLLRYAPGEDVVFFEGLAFFGIAFGGILLGRAAARASRRFLIPPERVLLVGGGPMAQVLVRKFRLHPEYELASIGYIDLGRDANLDLPYLGTPDEIDEVCASEGIERVVILSPRLSHDELADLIRRLRGADVRIALLPHVMDVLGSSVEIDDVEGITILGVTPPSLTRSSRLLKRGMDLFIAVPLLVVLAPIMLFISAAIKLTSPGPVFHLQERIGRAGRRFSILKFRTMVQDAEQKRGELAELSSHPVWLVLDHDPRITRVGRFLRHTSLDEVPQLWNVLRGEMSLVGPRPMPPDVDEHISGWGRRRLDLTPGITGLWQVLGRTIIPFEEMVKLDYLYVTNWSLWQDVRLLIRTLPAVVGRRGVN
jgi:exopolysaccharide biosynthesis polyprenyl glycosylphosphotransferase